MARLVHGVKAQKPVATRPRCRFDCPLEDVIAGRKTECQSPRLVRGENGRWVRDGPKASSHPCDRSKTAKGTNPKSDAGREANPPGEAAISPTRTWDTGLTKSSGE